MGENEEGGDQFRKKRLEQRVNAKSKATLLNAQLLEAESIKAVPDEIRK